MKLSRKFFFFESSERANLAEKELADVAAAAAAVLALSSDCCCCLFTPEGPPHTTSPVNTTFYNACSNLYLGTTYRVMIIPHWSTTNMTER